MSAAPTRLGLVTHLLSLEVAHMFSSLSRKMMLRLMRSRAEKHSGCRIDVARLATDPEYASAIRALASFTLDEELRAIGDLSSYGIGIANPRRAEGSVADDESASRMPAHLAQVLPFRMPAARL